MLCEQTEHGLLVDTVLVLSMMLIVTGSSAQQSGTKATEQNVEMCTGYHHLLADAKSDGSTISTSTEKEINPVLLRGYKLAKQAKCDLCHGIDGVRNTEAWGTLTDAPVIGGQRLIYLKTALRAYAAGAYWLQKIEDEGVAIDAMTINFDMFIMPRFSQDGERVMNGAVKELPGWKQDPVERNVKRLLDPDGLTAVATWYACGPDGKLPFGVTTK